PASPEGMPFGGPGGPAHRSLLSRFFFNPRELRAAWRLLIFLAIAAGCAALLSLPVHFLLSSSRAGVSLSRFSPQFLLAGEGSWLVAILISARFMAALEKRSFRDYALPWRSLFGARFWRGVLWGAIAISGLLLLIRLFHGFTFGGLATGGRRALVAGAFWALGFLVTGFFEEFLFRGYALSTLTTGMGFWPAAVVLSLAFGAVHLGNPGENWRGGVAAVLIGLFFCFTVRRTGVLWFAIGFHAMWDFCESFIYSVPDSGILTPNHLLNSAFHGSKWLTGGSVGPEGSVFVFLVIAILFIVFHLIYRQAVFPMRSRTLAGSAQTS
ncbi:MAG: lysostaphin resistance A-like protein, partial [Terriglobia bacterium]